TLPFRALWSARDQWKADPSVLAALGSVLLQKQRPQDALQFFTRAAAIEPLSTEYTFEYAVALQALGNAPGAIEKLQTVISADPAFQEAYVLLIHIYRDLGKREQARQIIDSYLRIMPQSLTFRMLP